MPRQPDRYRPSPRNICEVHEQAIELAHDRETGDIHTLRREVWFYRNQLSYFCLEQQVENTGGTSRVVCRIDVSEGAVRLHRFTDSGELAEPPVNLMIVPPHGRATLSANFERFVAEVLDNWAERCRSPIMTGERLRAAHALMWQLREVTAGRVTSVPKSALQHPAILALEDDQAKDVTDRVDRYPQPYLLAVFYPNRGTGTIVLAALESMPTTDDVMGVSEYVSIGMMIDSAGHITDD